MGNYIGSIEKLKKTRFNIKPELMKKYLASRYGEKPERWCKKHPFSFWGRNKLTGEYYRKCALGFKQSEECEAGE